ncbi:MAG: hypothetical protein AAF085_09360 [Planctomycetota bacterium]
MRFFLVFLFLGFVLPGCGASEPSDLKIILYAIDGPSAEGLFEIESFDVATADSDSDPPELFYNYPILGQVELTGTAAANELSGIVEKRVASEQGLIAGCFIPRHGLRVIRDGVTSDYVICFQCTNFEWYEGGSGKRIGQQSISSKYLAVFTKPLADAGIELAPSFLEED